VLICDRRLSEEVHKNYSVVKHDSDIKDVNAGVRPLRSELYNQVNSVHRFHIFLMVLTVQAGRICLTTKKDYLLFR